MYKEIIDGILLKEIFPELPEDLLRGKVEVWIKPQGDENPKLEKLLEKINKKVARTSYLGKEKEVLFLEDEGQDYEFKRSLLQRLKETGYEADLKEGARGTLVLSLAWSNKK